ncbi:MAG: ATP cone domain-containing protein [Patescibacteria group bacterium]
MPQITKTKPKSQAVKLAPKKVQKRDGSIVPYDLARVVTAIHKAMLEIGNGFTEKEALAVARKVEAELKKLARKEARFVPHVEQIQDLVEQQLVAANLPRVAKTYILYREERARKREVGLGTPEHVKELARQSKKYYKDNPLGEFIYYRTYSRWIGEEQRRETWVETVERYVAFMRENLGDKLQESEYKEVQEYILKHKALPSMRLLQFSGTAARSTNVCAYNCSFIAPETFQDFAEVMYISMCGTGVGFSVESEHIQKLPQIKYQTGKKLANHKIDDSKEGWCDALVLGMKTWADGNDVEFDYSGLRPAGARLKTMGGKSSGPEPLRQLLIFTRERMLQRQGRRLSNIDAHDILCMIGQIVVAGGVRRSAMISLSDLDDTEMRDAKKGQFYLNDPQRSMANNSAVYRVKPTNEEFLEEWLSLVKSRSGERGIFNRSALTNTLPKRRVEINPDAVLTMGTNPCGEILLRSKQFCNLTEVVARSNDTLETLKQKIRIAALLGTYQASLTKFPYLSRGWKKNCEEEALLGVSITGQWDSPTVRKPDVLKALRAEALKTNKKYAKRFGIKESTCITTVKPSGNTSQTVNSSSGMHPRHSQYYIRRVRIASTDALFKMLKDQGVPYHPEVGQSHDSATTYVIEFPVKSPKGSIFKDDVSALEQLEHWKKVKINYTEHNPSTTISVGDDEWIEVGNWVYKNWDIVGGLSFLPRSNHVYQLAPYEACDKATYEKLLDKVKDIDFAKIVEYERVDETENKRELACVGGACEL